MSGRGFNNRGRGGSQRGGFANRGGRGGFNNNAGPPDSVIEMGLFLHPCEGEMVCARSPSQNKIPYFNAPIYLENKTQIGKVDEILGPMTEVFFTVKLDSGVVASSFKPNDKVYIAADKLLPLDRFLPKPKPAGGKPSKPLGKQGMVAKPARGGRGGSRGGRGGARGGSARGGSRGGFGNRGSSRGGSRGGRGRGGY